MSFSGHNSSTLLFRRAFCLIGIVVSLAGISSSAETSTAVPKTPKRWFVSWQPVRLVNGAPVLFRVTAPVRLATLSGTWEGHGVYFDFNPRTKVWYGLAGVSLETRSGLHPLLLRGTSARGEELSFERKINVHRAKYPSIAVTVPQKFTEPSQEELRRIDDERTLKKDVFSGFDPQREWSGVFRPAVRARISDVFGTRRVFNGEVKSMHQGLDYAVPSGTPVLALNRGVVLLARPMFFEGNCVMLDHGQGLLTIYMHLSKIEVKEGEIVQRGQEIALSGGTGRATGPHLHVAVRWQGVYLNPMALMKLKLPVYPETQIKMASRDSEKATADKAATAGKKE